MAIQFAPGPAADDYAARKSTVPLEVQRQIAALQELQKSSQSTAPLYSKGLGYGNVMASALGGLLEGQTERKEQAAQQAYMGDMASAAGLPAPAAPKASPNLIQMLFNGGGKGADTPSDSAASSYAPTQSAPQEAPALVPAPQANTTDKVYKNDEPSPLDPPSGQDRTKMLMTILGEENSPEGQAGVANVIRNRAVDGGYGGDTPSAVVTAKNQFEPWNTPEGRARMAKALADPKQLAAADRAISDAYGEGGRAPNDPTEGKLMFYSPDAQAALGRPAPNWAQGEGQKLGNTMFYDDNSLNAPVKVASANPNFAPGQPQGQPAPQPQQAAAQPPQQVAQAGPQQFTPFPEQTAALQRVVASPRATPQERMWALGQLSPEHQLEVQNKYLANQKAQGELSNAPIDTDMKRAQLAKAQGEVGNLPLDTERQTLANAKTRQDLNAEGAVPLTAAERQAYNIPPTTVVYKDKNGALKFGPAGTNINNNVDLGTSQTYDKQLAEGLGKAHASLANGVEASQARARDLAAMQGAVDAIQKNGGTTGGMGQQTVQDLKKTINAGAATLGMQPFNENDISDKEFLTKFNRQIAGAQAKDAVGSRVTNFEMSNYLKANPGLDMSVTGNQRLLGIQSQIEQRNIAVGNSIRDATAQAISQGEKIDPRTVQKIISGYDDEHHVKDPVTGQDLTQSYTLPEFQKPEQGTNSSLAVGHETNINGIKIKRVN